ncbi:hypothetical protein SH661x_001272 [Planctomicrobium sp. SH661]|uniref:hypothetical protein n=1 Tax=Planctomicrobium sp. SH661 TaxID=3448124 RepID=UPI003F5AFB44
MRLTLRTILAYLDDVLEPAQAREIGEKISESKEATDLVSRIQDVMRRRRIGAPELAGPGSGPDPNLVSDYLENLLPPNEVVELERLCQASDVHLAEVAACHKILSMVVGQPIDVSDEMRERMYLLGGSKSPVETPSSGSVPAMAEGMAGVETETESGLPEYLTRRSFFQQYGGVSLVVLGAIFWVAFVWTDSSLWSRQPLNEALSRPAVAEAKPAAGEVAAATPAPAPNQANPRNIPMPGGPVPNSAVPVVVQTPAGGIIPPAPAPATGPAVAANANTLAPGSNPAMSPRPEPPSPEPPLPANPNVPPEVVRDMLPESPLSYQSGDEFIIKHLAANPDWYSYPVTIPIEVDDELASPAPFRNTYGIVNVLDVTLEPGTRIQRLPRTEQTSLGLLLNRGRLILTRPLTTPEPVTLELLAAGQSWLITLLEPGTRVAVEYGLPIPQGPPDEKLKLIPRGGVAVVSGRIQISSQGQPALGLTREDGTALWPAEGTELVLKAELAAPSWALQEESLITPAARQLARLFQKEFLADRTISQCLGPVVNDRRAGISELAVKTLAMIGQYPYVVGALQSDHQESRLAAIQALREWLGEDPEQNTVLLEQELGKTFRGESVPTLERLLWGYSVQDAANPHVSRQLLDWMKDDQIAIRQLAFENVSRLVGKTYDYLPMAPPAERRAALGRWDEYLKRSGGTLLPPEPAVGQ